MSARVFSFSAAVEGRERKMLSGVNWRDHSHKPASFVLPARTISFVPVGDADGAVRLHSIPIIQPSGESL